MLIALISKRAFPAYLTRMQSQTQGSVCDLGNCQPQVGANGKTLLVALERFNTPAFFQFPDLISLTKLQWCF